MVSYGDSHIHILKVNAGHLAGRNGSMGEEKRKVECDGGQHDIDVWQCHK